MFTASSHNPQIVTHKTTLQGVVYQLDVALQSPDTQKNGLVFIYDMSGSKYFNFDYELSQKILTMLKVSECASECASTFVLITDFSLINLERNLERKSSCKRVNQAGEETFIYCRSRVFNFFSFGSLAPTHR